MTGNAQSPKLIPDHLLENLRKGDRVLFWGADLPLGYEGAPFSRPELALALAKKYDLPTALSWPETAQAYLGRFSGDQQGLISFVMKHCSGSQVKAGPIHQAIAHCGFRAIVTAWYDKLLEDTLEQVGYRVNRVVRDLQLAYAQEGEQEVIVLKLFGDFSDPESLILNTWDHDRLLDRLSRKLEVVISYCVSRPPLFVGFDLTEQTPRRLYMRASTNMAEHMRRIYAVWSHSLESLQAIWQGQNVEFIQADAEAFLSALAKELPSSRPDQRKTIRVHRPPYKFLDYYSPQDTDIFCGRDTENQIVTRLVLSFRLLTLFGPSGAGKTSLLLAGILPRLQAEGYHSIYIQVLDDPLPAIRKAMATELRSDDWKMGNDLGSFFQASLGVEDKLIVVLDQFEELFLRVGSENRAAFFAELGDMVTSPTREIRFIFCVREDYLGRLDEARAHLPDIFNHSYRLPTLTRGNARVAITEPAARAGIVIEPALVDILVGNEWTEIEAAQSETSRKGDLVEADGYVPPAALQIVMDRLYRLALPPDYPSDASPPSSLQLTLNDYQVIHHSLGAEGKLLRGAEAILAGYVDEGLARLSGLTQADGQTPLGADPNLGEAILKVMVTSQATKTARTQTEILNLLDEAGLVLVDEAADRSLVENTRLGLERVRLLRSLRRGGVSLYELAHDHLAAAVTRRMSEIELKTKLARELLRQEMDNWHGTNLLMRSEALALIDERRNDLRRLSYEELEFLFRSAYKTNYEYVYWAKRAREGGVAVGQIVITDLSSPDFHIRAAAVTALGQLSDEVFIETLAGMLGDPYPQVRVRAIRALESYGTLEAWETLLRGLKYEVYVPAGEFRLGEGKEEHWVFEDAFYVGKYPVTTAEYKQYIDDIQRIADFSPNKTNHPMVQVSWYDCRDYATWAEMRLLTEVEWEKAASWNEEKGKVRYPWGDTFVEGWANTREANLKDTTPIGQFSPNGDSAYGCADMVGNVWEWTSSLYRPYPYQSDDGREDPTATNARVLRGGSFRDRAASVHCADRYDNGRPNFRFGYFGFRVGLTAAPNLPVELADQINLKRLRNNEVHVRVTAVIEASKSNRTAFIEPLIEILNDPHWEVYQAVIEALEKLIPQGEWRQRLLPRLEANDPQIRTATIAALGRSGSKVFVDPLTRKLGDRHPAVYEATITALEELAPEGTWRQKLTKKEDLIIEEDLPDWLRELEVEATPSVAEPSKSSINEEELPAWLVEVQEEIVDKPSDTLVEEKSPNRLREVEDTPSIDEATDVPVVTKRSSSLSNKGITKATSTQKSTGLTTVKIVITGPFSAGKTVFISSVSEIDVVTTERRITSETERIKEETTVSMDFGRITIDDNLVLYLFGTPGQRRFDFMWEILSEGMLGFIVLIDSVRPDTFREAKHILETFRSYTTIPYIIAANKQDFPDAWSPEDIRIALKIDSGIKIVPCVARDQESVKNVLLELLYSILESMQAKD